MKVGVDDGIVVVTAEDDATVSWITDVSMVQQIVLYLVSMCSKSAGFGGGCCEVSGMLLAMMFVKQKCDDLVKPSDLVSEVLAMTMGEDLTCRLAAPSLLKSTSRPALHLCECNHGAVQ